MPKGKTHIHSNDFDGFISEVTAEIWNSVIHHPAFHKLQPGQFADLFEAVSHALIRYRHSSAGTRKASA